MKKFSTAAAILFTVLGVFSAQAKLNPEKASKGIQTIRFSIFYQNKPRPGAGQHPERVLQSEKNHFGNGQRHRLAKVRYPRIF